MIGVITNAAAVIVGSLIGMLFKKGIPEKISKWLMRCIGLSTFYIAVSGMTDENANALIVILSVAAGGLIGGLCDLDGLLSKGCEKVAKKFSKGGESGKIAEGFVSSSILFCVGAMTVLGSIQAGISKDYTTLFTKSVLDFVSSFVFASAFGIGVTLSSVAVIVIQGGICLASGIVAPYLSDFMISNINVVGSVAILAISLNLIEITKIKVANLVPAVFLPIALCPLCNLISDFLSNVFA